MTSSSGVSYEEKRRILLATTELYTTGYWYVRLCRPVLGANERIGVLSRPFAELPPKLRDQAMGRSAGAPRGHRPDQPAEFAPTIATLHQHHQRNILSIEALAAATHLGARVFLSAPAPLLESALRQENLVVRVSRSK